MIKKSLIFFFMIILFSSFAVASNYVALQGTVKQSGEGILAGDLRVYIYNDSTGGTLVYDSSTDFNDAVVNGTYDVMLGSGSNVLNLDYGEKYYIDFTVNSEDFDFDGSERKVFESAVGNVTYLHLNPNIPASYINKSAGTNWLGIDLETILDTIYTWNTTSNIINLGFNTTAQLNNHFVLTSDLNKSSTNDSDLLDGYDSSFFMPLNTSVSGEFDFNGGWTGGGLTISSGNLFAQTIYVYNLSSLAVNELNVNGSIIPQDGFDNLFDLGSGSLRWRDLYLGGEIYSNGTGNNYFAGNVGIGTNDPDAKLDVEVSSGGAAIIGSSLNTATGNYAIAMGYNANASGSSAIAMGTATIASKTSAKAIGFNADATGSYAISIGSYTTASGNTATAMGYYTTASGLMSMAMGRTSIASGDYSIAMGREIEAGEDYVFAIGLADMNGINCNQANSMCIMGGNVGIGTTSPNQELNVIGDINATGTIYKNGGTAVDYVFDDYFGTPTNSEYDGLISLDELYDYVKENHYLPNYEPEKYTGQVEVGKMSEMNLEKIEELTLYILELKEENNKLKQENKLIKETLCDMGREEWC